MIHHDWADTEAFMFFAVFMMLIGLLMVVAAIWRYVRREQNFIANDELTSERITVDLRDRAP